MNELSKYTVERISADRLKDLWLLSRNVLTEKVSLNYFRKKFATEYCGAQYIGYLAYDANRNAVAYYGLYPCKIIFNGKEMVVAVSGDTMTHSDHRGKGLFVQLAKKTFELAKTEAVQFAFGFPNQNSLSGSLKAGWTYSGEKMRRYVLNVSTLPLAKLFQANRLLRWLHEKYSSLVLSFYQNEKKYFSNSVIEENIDGVLHDKDFFRYKNYSNNSVIKISGVQVWLKPDGELKIGDMERTNDFDFKRLEKKLKTLAFFLGCRKISFLTSPETWLDKILSKELSFQETFLVARINLGCDVPMEQIKFSAGDFDTF